MSKYNSAIEQNISVWARRLGVEIQNLGNAAAYAQKICGGRAGRHGAITVAAMKPLSEILDRPMSDDLVTVAAIAAAKVIYDVVYNDVTGNTKDMFLKNMSNANLHVTSNADAICTIIAKGISSRTHDHTKVSVTGVVLRKLKY